MPDRREFLTTAGLAALAAGTAAATSGCSRPVQLGTGSLQATIKASDVPLGGGVVLQDARFVVTQPSPGVYKAFDRTCTHQDCPVKKVMDGRIQCSCHGSSYSIVDGSVLTGPATKPLPPKTVAKNGDDLQLGQ